MSLTKLSSKTLFLLSFFLIETAYAESSLWRMGELKVVMEQDREMISLRNFQQDGELLFKGKVHENKLIGNAFYYRSNCKPTPYTMSGELIERQKIVLHGAVPVFEKDGCTPSFFSMGAPGWAYAFDYISPVSHK